jgi:PST family polysaccharide transporter
MPEGHEFSALKRRVVSSVFFSSGAQVLRQLIQLGCVALLARMLGPRPYGLVALAASVMGLLQLAVDLGLGSSAVRERNLSPLQESTLFRLNLLGALLVGAGVMAAAPLLAALFGQPALAWILRWIAPGFLLSGALQTRRAALQREMRFRELAGIDLLSVAVGALTSVGLARFGGMRTGALVLGSLAQQGTSCLGILRCAGLPPRAGFAPRAVLPLLGFGGWFTAFSVVNYFARTLDNMLVGGLMGAIALGLYEKSYALMMLPVTQISAVVSQVLYPALARVKEDRERFAFLYLGAVRKIAGLAFPVSALCVAAAGPVVRLLLGPRFEGAVPIFQALSLVMALQTLPNAAGWIYLARGEVRRMFLIGLANGAVVCGALVFGAMRGSPVEVAKAYVAAILVVFGPTMHLALRTGGIPTGLFLRRIAPPAISAAAAAGASLALGASSLPAAAAVVGSVYLVCHALLDREALRDLVRFLDPRRALEVE